MRLQLVRQCVRNMYDRLTDAAVPATLVRKIYGPHDPDGATPVDEQAVTARLIRLPRPAGAGGIESGPVVDDHGRAGLLECPAMAPMAADEIVTAGGRVTIVRVSVLDLGAGGLYEVWYQ
jgi:hypothetical protein